MNSAQKTTEISSLQWLWTTTLILLIIVIPTKSSRATTTIPRAKFKTTTTVEILSPSSLPTTKKFPSTLALPDAKTTVNEICLEDQELSQEKITARFLGQKNCKINNSSNKGNEFHFSGECIPDGFFVGFTKTRKSEFSGELTVSAKGESAEKSRIRLKFSGKKIGSCNP